MGSTTRITGMYSGMDTDALVEEMLAANKTPLNNFQREKIEVEWQRETLLDLNKQMLEVQNMSKDLQDDAKFKVYNTETTNSKLATATATKDAVEGTYTLITTQLATATTLTSTPISKNPEITGIKSSARISYDDSLEKTSFNITLNGITKTITFGLGEGEFDEDSDIEKIFQDKIDDAFGAEQIKISIDNGVTGFDILGFTCGSDALKMPIIISTPDSQTLDKLGTSDALSIMNIKSGTSNVFDTTTTIKDLLGDSVTATEIDINVNGYSETISTNTTISDLFKKINNSGEDVSIKYDHLSDAIIMKRESTGAGRVLEISDNLGLFDTLGLFKSAETYEEGKNAIVSISDSQGRFREDIKLTSNSFTYEGVNFNLTKADPNDEVSITVAKDVDAIFDNIVEFVDKYNSLLGKLNELYNEKPNRDYDPLLDEERDELSDTQQEKWDKLAKQGILYRDSDLQSAISSMRSAVTSVFSTNANIKSLFQIGISTTSYSSTGNDNGKLIIDEGKLKEAINENMDEVAALFTNKPDYISGTVIPSNAKITAGSSFKITVNGNEQTITFDKDYNLFDEAQKSEMISNLNSILINKFGSKNVVAAISGGRMIVTSQKGSSIVMNSGTGNDALSVLGIEDGAQYDANALGFSNKIYNIMERVQSDITDKAGGSPTNIDESTLGEKLKDLNSYISRQQDRLAALEDRYYAQFAAMENALAQLDSQSSYVASMLGGSGM